MRAKFNEGRVYHLSTKFIISSSSLYSHRSKLPRMLIPRSIRKPKKSSHVASSLKFSPSVPQHHIESAYSVGHVVIIRRGWLFTLGVRQGDYLGRVENADLHSGLIKVLRAV